MNSASASPFRLATSDRLPAARLAVALAAVLALTAVFALVLGLAAVPTAATGTGDLSVDVAPGEVHNAGSETTATFTVDAPDEDDPFDLHVSAAALGADDLLGVIDDASHAVDDSTVAVTDVEDGDAIVADFDSIAVGTHAFEFVDPDTSAEATASVGVTEPEVDGGFGADVYEARAGGFVDVDVSLDGAATGYVIIGGDRFSDGGGFGNFVDVLHVSGSPTVRINTRLLGTNVPSEEVYDADGAVVSYLHDPDDERFDDVTFVDGDGTEIAADFEEFRHEIGVSDLPRPLQPDRYRLLVGADGTIVLRDDGVPDFDRPLGRSNLLVTAPTVDGAVFGNVTMYTAPAGGASDADSVGELRGTLTERDRVAAGDRLVVSFEARGLWGLLSWLDDRVGATEEGPIDPGTVEALLGLPEGVVLDVEHANPGLNRDALEVAVGTATDGDLSLYPDGAGEAEPPSLDRYYLVVNTGGSGPFSDNLEGGEAFDLEIGYVVEEGDPNGFAAVDHDAVGAGADAVDDDAVDRFPYLDAGADDLLETLSFTVEAPAMSYDRIDRERRLVVANVSNASLSGTTNYAPGTDVTIQLVGDRQPPGTKITIDDVTIEANGTFDVREDFSALAVGEAVEVEFYVDERLFDKRSARVVDDADAYPRFDVATHPERHVVEADTVAESLTATVRNDGVASGLQTVALRIGGETVVERSLVLDGGASRDVAFDLPVTNLSVGSYEYVVVTDDDEATGTLVVEDSTAAASTPVGGDAPTVTPDADADSDDDEEPSDDGWIPAVPIAGRDLVGAAILVGAAHVLGHWT